MSKTPRKKNYYAGSNKFAPKAEIMTDEQMDERNSTAVSKSTFYSKDIDAGEKVGSAIEYLQEITKDAYSMAVSPERRIRCKDTDQVKDTMERYLRSCQRTGAIPTKSGFSAACGVDRRTFNQFIKNNPEHPTSCFLRAMFEGFADVEIQAAQSGAIHPIFAMFLLKVFHEFRENEPVETVAENPLGEITDPAELARKYAEMLPAYEENTT